MTTLLDGPGKGHVLHLRRSPHFLRVVIIPQRIPPKVDVLDLLTDEPAAHEELHCYVRTGGIGVVHLKMAKPARSGFYSLAEYEYHINQPSDEVMRDTEKWRAWCLANHDQPKSA